MEQNTEQQKTIQQFRHEAKRNLTEARERLALRTDETREVYVLLNGSIEGVLAGRPGYTQEQQVERLSEARDRLVANLESLPEKVEAAKAAILAQIEGWEQSIAEKAHEAVVVLEDAINVAQTRDFEAHQKAKGRYSYNSGLQTNTYSDVEDEDEDYTEDED